jgi:hypothetical protein
MFVLLEISDPDAVTVMRSHKGVSVREVARAHRLNALPLTAEYLNALEDELVSDINASHAVAVQKHGTDDLTLVPDVLPFGQPTDMVKPHVVVWGNDELDDEELNEPTTIDPNSHVEQ